MGIKQLILDLQDSGIKIWAEGDRLRYSAPKGKITPSLFRQLKEQKADILLFLRKIDVTAPTGSMLIPSVSREQNLPLSFAQQRLWFLDKFEGEGKAYNESGAIHIEGQLNAPAFEKALNEIVRRHEVLRTVFTTLQSEEGFSAESVQIILPEQSIEMDVIDISGLPQKDREKRAGDICLKVASKSFDLSKGPLNRINMIKLGDKSHIFLTIRSIWKDFFQIQGLYILSNSTLIFSKCPSVNQLAGSDVF